MMISFSFLITLCILLLLLLALMISLFKAKKKKVIYAIALIIIVLVIKDVGSYYILTQRANVIRAELKPGMTIDQMTDYLRDNKKRLHISSWKYSEQGDQGWFFINIHAPFSLSALLSKGEGAWYLLADIDKDTKIMEKIR